MAWHGMAWHYPMLRYIGRKQRNKDKRMNDGINQSTNQSILCAYLGRIQIEQRRGGSDRIGSETVRLWWCREYEPLSMAMGGGPEGGIRQVLNSFGRHTPAAGSCRNATQRNDSTRNGSSAAAAQIHDILQYSTHGIIHSFLSFHKRFVGRGENHVSPVSI